MASFYLRVDNYIYFFPQNFGSKDSETRYFHKMLNFVLVLYYNHAKSIWKVDLCVSLFSPTNEDTHLTFYRRPRTHKNTEDLRGFFTLELAMGSLQLELSDGSLSSPLAVLGSDVGFSNKILMKFRS